jgi:cellulose synthase/poly-beta-1,6-N-acetylglucosamine synthase-like glycosyltransferase
MIPLIIVFFSVYVLFGLWLYTGLKKASQFKISPATKIKSSFSVVIAAHNEENDIAETLDCLSKQTYPEEHFEVILVADRCVDRTVQIAREKSQSLGSLKILEIDETPKDFSPKKFALQEGIFLARYQFCILLDADCLTAPSFLNTMNQYFQTGIQVLVNVPKFEPKKILLHDYLLPERLVAWGIAAAAVGHGKPFLSFGTTWAYTKEIFKKVGGFGEISQVLGGDDDLMISRMGKFSAKIAFCLQESGWGRTRAPESLIEFIVQRRRHHSVGKYYPSRVKLGYGIFHIANFGLWVFPFIFLPALWILIMKMAMDYYLLRFSGDLFKENFNLKSFIFFEGGFVLQHLLVAPLGFLGKIRWR